MALHVIKLFKIVDTGGFRILLILVPIFAFLKLVLANLTPSLEGNPPSALPPLAFDWEQLKLLCSLLRPRSLCRAASAEVSDSSNAPPHHLGRCRVGQERKRNKRSFADLL